MCCRFFDPLNSTLIKLYNNRNEIIMNPTRNIVIHKAGPANSLKVTPAPKSKTSTPTK